MYVYYVALEWHQWAQLGCYVAALITGLAALCSCYLELRDEFRQRGWL